MGIKKTESIDVMDAVGSNIRVDTYNWEVKEFCLDSTMTLMRNGFQIRQGILVMVC